MGLNCKNTLLIETMIVRLRTFSTQKRSDPLTDKFKRITLIHIIQQNPFTRFIPPLNEQRQIFTLAIGVCRWAVVFTPN